MRFRGSGASPFNGNFSLQLLVNGTSNLSDPRLPFLSVGTEYQKFLTGMVNLEGSLRFLLHFRGKPVDYLHQNKLEFPMNLVDAEIP